MSALTVASVLWCSETGHRIQPKCNSRTSAMQASGTAVDRLENISAHKDTLCCAHRYLGVPQHCKTSTSSFLPLQLRKCNCFPSGRSNNTSVISKLYKRFAYFTSWELNSSGISTKPQPPSFRLISPFITIFAVKKTQQIVHYCVPVQVSCMQTQCNQNRHLSEFQTVLAKQTYLAESRLPLSYSMCCAWRR
jgi:hypothetical protein